MSIATGPSAQVLDTKGLRRAYGGFATGITVVTVGGPSPHGMTANSFTSVSLDPPLILICIDRKAIMHVSLDSTDFFGVSVLAGHQEGIARHFSNRWRPLGAAQFEGVGWHPAPHGGSPLIGGAVASFECQRWQTYDGGDHTIFVGRVLSVERRPEEEPLLFFNGRFRDFATAPTGLTA